MDEVNPTNNQTTPLELPTVAAALKLNQEFWAESQEKLITTATELLTQKIIAEVVAALQDDDMKTKFQLFQSQNSVSMHISVMESELKSVISDAMKAVLSNDELEKLGRHIEWSALPHNIRDPRVQLFFKKDGIAALLKGVREKISEMGWDTEFSIHMDDIIPSMVKISTPVTPKDNQNGNNSGGGGGGGR